MQDSKALEPAGAADAAHRARPLTVNGEAQLTTATTLLELLADLGYGGRRVATAVNGDFVPERLRASRRLAEGDAVEIVAPRQGG